MFDLAYISVGFEIIEDHLTKTDCSQIRYRDAGAVYACNERGSTNGSLSRRIQVKWPWAVRELLHLFVEEVPRSEEVSRCLVKHRQLMHYFARCFVKVLLPQISRKRCKLSRKVKIVCFLFSQAVPRIVWIVSHAQLTRLSYANRNR
jgi:hypothetical protein